jgi:hypothetical protein
MLPVLDIDPLVAAAGGRGRCLELDSRHRAAVTAEATNGLAVTRPARSRGRKGLRS